MQAQWPAYAGPTHLLRSMQVAAMLTDVCQAMGKHARFSVQGSKAAYEAA
jgi:hypothetical protein